MLPNHVECTEIENGKLGMMKDLATDRIPFQHFPESISERLLNSAAQLYGRYIY